MLSGVVGSGHKIFRLVGSDCPAVPSGRARLVRNWPEGYNRARPSVVP
jgi:hypothetical protein